MRFVFVIENPSYWDQFFSQHHQHRFEALTVSKPSEIASNYVADFHGLQLVCCLICQPRSRRVRDENVIVKHVVFVALFASIPHVQIRFSVRVSHGNLRAAASDIVIDVREREPVGYYLSHRFLLRF